MASIRQRLRALVKPEVAASTETFDAGWFGVRDAQLSGWYLSESGELFRGFPVTAEDVVVDVGCGDGGNLSFCSAQGACVIGIDLDSDALGVAEERVAANASGETKFMVAPAEHLPLPDAVASRVICTEVLEHVDDPAVVMAELFRVGRPGALYLITVPDALQERMQQNVAAPEYFAFPNHIRIIERDELPRLVRDAGLEVLDQQGYGFFWGIWWAMSWGCGSVEGAPDGPPEGAAADHPALMNWAKAWAALLESEDGREVKRGLEQFMPKSQVIVARKP